jgi:hypothetical protein
LTDLSLHQPFQRTGRERRLAARRPGMRLRFSASTYRCAPFRMSFPNPFKHANLRADRELPGGRQKSARSDPSLAIARPVRIHILPFDPPQFNFDEA